MRGVREQFWSSPPAHSTVSSWTLISRKAIRQPWEHQTPPKDHRQLCSSPLLAAQPSRCLFSLIFQQTPFRRIRFFFVQLYISFPSTACCVYFFALPTSLIYSCFSPASLMITVTFFCNLITPLQYPASPLICSIS